MRILFLTILYVPLMQSMHPVPNDGNPLLDAVSRRDIVAVQRFLKDSADLMVMDDKCKSIIFYVILNNDIEMLKLLWQVPLLRQNVSSLSLTGILVMMRGRYSSDSDSEALGMYNRAAVFKFLVMHNVKRYANYDDQRLQQLGDILKWPLSSFLSQKTSLIDFDLIRRLIVTNQIVLDQDALPIFSFGSVNLERAWDAWCKKENITYPSFAKAVEEWFNERNRSLRINGRPSHDDIMSGKIKTILAGNAERQLLLPDLAKIVQAYVTDKPVEDLSDKSIASRIAALFCGC